MILREQAPQGFGMALHAVCAAEDKECTVQHLQNPLHLGGKIHMARRVQQGDFQLAQGEHGLFGENCDAALPLQRVGIEKGVAMIDPAQPAQLAAGVEHGLGEGGLARVDMGENAHRNPFFRLRHCSQLLSLNSIQGKGHRVKGGGENCENQFWKGRRASRLWLLPWQKHTKFPL